MTNKQLIKVLEKFPDDMEVYFRKINEEFDYVTVEFLNVKSQIH